MRGRALDPLCASVPLWFAFLPAMAGGNLGTQKFVDTILNWGRRNLGTQYLIGNLGTQYLIGCVK